MDFSREEMLNKYTSIYEQYIAPLEPDFVIEGDETRYTRFNDAWRFLDPFDTTENLRP